MNLLPLSCKSCRGFFWKIHYSTTINNNKINSGHFSNRFYVGLWRCFIKNLLACRRQREEMIGIKWINFFFFFCANPDWKVWNSLIKHSLVLHWLRSPGLHKLLGLLVFLQWLWDWFARWVRLTQHSHHPLPQPSQWCTGLVVSFMWRK